MKKVRALSVGYNGRPVGRLALTLDGFSAFEYNSDWLAAGFSISPFSLPLKDGVFVQKRREPFEGGFGIFADSLPDGWGRLLLDRILLKNHLDPYGIDILQRLAIVGRSGMGALVYEPEISLECAVENDDLDLLARSCQEVLTCESPHNLDLLFKLGGSSGGARPKILTTVDGEEWIIKFPASMDREDIGEEEYRYSLCARECGIEMPETRLFPSKVCGGYFGVKRFDRVVSGGEKRRVHMASVSALLETSHRVPNLDYNMLMKLTLELTRDFNEVERMFRLMCFNVFAHNRDDHSKNFTFIFDERCNSWRLSPAYDLTYSNSIGGEHATTVDGEGKNPRMEDVLSVAKKIGLNLRKARAAADEIKDKTEMLLKDRD